MPNNYYNAWGNQQYSQYPSQQMPMSPFQQVFVQGKAGAQAYPFPPGCNFMILWEADPSKPIFYIKQTDQSGRPMPVEAFHYEKDVDPPVVHPSDLTKYVTAEQLQDLIGRMSVGPEGRIVLNESGT